MRNKIVMCLGGFFALLFSFSLSAEAIVPVELKEELLINLSSAEYSENEGALTLYDTNQIDLGVLDLSTIPDNTVGLALTFQIINFDYENLTFKYELGKKQNSDNLEFSEAKMDELYIKNDGTYILVLNLQDLKGSMDKISTLKLVFQDENKAVLNQSSETTLQINALEYLDQEAELDYIVTGEISDSFMFNENAEEGIVIEGFVAEEGFVIGDALDDTSSEGAVVLAENTDSDQISDSVENQNQEDGEQKEMEQENSIVSFLLLAAVIVLVLMAAVLVFLQIVKNKK